MASHLKYLFFFLCIFVAYGYTYVSADCRDVKAASSPAEPVQLLIAKMNESDYACAYLNDGKKGKRMGVIVNKHPPHKHQISSLVIDQETNSLIYNAGNDEYVAVIVDKYGIEEWRVGTFNESEDVRRIAKNLLAEILQ